MGQTIMVNPYTQGNEFLGFYTEWTAKRFEFLKKYYGKKFFKNLRILDLGGGYGHLGNQFVKLGSSVTCAEARIENIENGQELYPKVKFIHTNLEDEWPLTLNNFDLILNFGLIYHLNMPDFLIKNCYKNCKHMILDTKIFDVNKEYIKTLKEHTGYYDRSYTGAGCRPSTLYVEKLLSECGFKFQRKDISDINIGYMKYDWQPGSKDNIDKRRLWICEK